MAHIETSQQATDAVFARDNTFAQLYEKELVSPVFTPWAKQLIERASPARGAAVLDVACGTGIVARLARERIGQSSRFVGVDRNEEMLSVARAVAPDIDWRQGDAAALPLERGETFDFVFCHQGIQFFSDKPAAASAMHRALKGGGVVAVGVWRSLQEYGVFAELDAIAERIVGTIDDARHSFPDADALAALLTDAGFSNVDVQARSLKLQFRLDSLVPLNAAAVVGMSERGRTMTETEKRSAITEVIASSLAELRPRCSDGLLYTDSSANLGIGYA